MITRKPRKTKVAGFLRALEMMEKQGMSQYLACERAGISRMTFNKYREMFGDKLSDTQIEVLPKDFPETKLGIKKTETLELLTKENAIMERNLQLKKELGLLQ